MKFLKDSKRRLHLTYLSSFIWINIIFGFLVLVIIKNIAATTDATTARPKPMKIGSKKGITIRVAGRVKPKHITPKIPKIIPFDSLLILKN